jgi:hypothetical protein
VHGPGDRLSGSPKRQFHTEIISQIEGRIVRCLHGREMAGDKTTNCFSRPVSKRSKKWSDPPVPGYPFIIFD